MFRRPIGGNTPRQANSARAPKNGDTAQRYADKAGTLREGKVKTCLKSCRRMQPREEDSHSRGTERVGFQALFGNNNP